jgi:hypothetical protein
MFSLQFLQLRFPEWERDDAGRVTPNRYKFAQMRTDGEQTYHGGTETRRRTKSLKHRGSGGRKKKNHFTADCADERGSERIAKIANTAKIAGIENQNL